MATMLQSALHEFQEAWERVSWEHPESNWGEPQRTKIVVCGLSGAGKKTLFNSVWGWEAVESSMTTTPRDLGLFMLLDMPSDVTDGVEAMFSLEEAVLIIYLIDGEHGLRPADFHWIARMRARKVPLLVILNKADLCGELVDQAVAHIQTQLKLTVMPLSGRKPDDVRTHLLPAILDAAPEIVLPLASHVPELRQQAALRLVRQGVSSSLLASIGPAMLMDNMAVADVQVKLITQISELYDVRLPGLAQWQSALVVAFGASQRLIARVLSRFWPQTAWFVSGMIGMASTWVLGRVVLLYLQRPR